MRLSGKVIVSVALVFALAIVFSSASFAKEPNQKMCPVVGGMVNKNIYTDYQGKRIYFCCPPCIPEFKKNPEKYMKKLEKDGVVLEDAPVQKKK